MPVIYGEDRPIYEVAPGVRRQFLIRGAVGSSRVSVVPSESLPGCVPPEHQHADEEIFIFLEGIGIGAVGEERVDIRPGVVLIVPPNTTHWFKNTGNTPLRQIVIYPNPKYDRPVRDRKVVDVGRPLVCVSPTTEQ